MTQIGKVGYLAGQLFPSTLADTHQVMKTVSALGAEGLDIELVIPGPLPTWIGAFPSEAEINAYYAIRHPVRIRFLPVLPCRAGSEAWKEIGGFLSPFLAATRHYQVLYVRHWGTLLGIHASGRPFVYENHRVLRIQYPRRVRLVQRMLRSPRCLGVVTNAPMVSDAYAELGVSPERILTAHNGFDPEDMDPCLERAAARAKLGLDPARPVVVYAGNLSPHKGTESLLPVARQVPGARFLLVGGTPDELTTLRARLAAEGVTNVELPGWKRHVDLVEYLYAADVLVIPPSSQAYHRTGPSTVVPLKLYTYLAAGRPIVAPDLEDMRQVLSHEANGLLCPPDDAASCARAIRRLLEDPALSGALSERARRDSEQYTWRSRARLIIAFLQRQVAAASGLRA